MISNIRFSRSKKELLRGPCFYVYHNSSETTLIVGKGGDWDGIDRDVPAILSHETLHKVLFIIDGSTASRGLDRWCKSRKWRYLGASGICFFKKELLQTHLSGDF